MKKSRITLKEAVKFHGHLGPYLVLGILAGEMAIKKLGCNKYFGLEVKVCGANKKPKSCLIDGLQLSTGATYGKGNIRKISADKIKVSFYSLNTKKMIALMLKQDVVNKLDCLKGHVECEVFAKKLYKTKPSELFVLTTGN